MPVRSRGAGPRRATRALESIRELAIPVAHVLGQPGLPIFLAAREVMAAGVSHRGSGRRLGPLGLDPRAVRLDQIGRAPAVLSDPRWAIALASWQIARMRTQVSRTLELDWFAIARGFVEPRLVDDVSDRNIASQYATGGLLQALSQMGEPPRFAKEQAFPSGYRWPGLPEVLQALGVPEAS